MGEKPLFRMATAKEKTAVDATKPNRLRLTIKPEIVDAMVKVKAKQQQFTGVEGQAQGREHTPLCRKIYSKPFR